MLGVGFLPALRLHFRPTFPHSFRRIHFVEIVLHFLRLQLDRTRRQDHPEGGDALIPKLRFELERIRRSRLVRDIERPPSEPALRALHSFRLRPHVELRKFHSAGHVERDGGFRCEIELIWDQPGVVGEGGRRQ
jgi:hypothetical protein